MSQLFASGGQSIGASACQVPISRNRAGSRVTWLLLPMWAETPSEPHPHPFPCPVSTEDPQGTHPGPALCQGQGHRVRQPRALLPVLLESSPTNPSLRPRDGEGLTQAPGKLNLRCLETFQCSGTHCWPEFSGSEVLHP